MPRTPNDADFTEFVQASWPSLFRTAYLLLGNKAEAEDLVQTALAKTYAAWGSVRSLDAAPGYARTVLTNTAASWFRKKSWRREQATEHLPDSGHVTDLDARPSVIAALSQLAPRQRAVVVLRFYEDLSVAETAHALQISEGTVKSQTSNALDRLRVLLGDAVIPAHLGASND